MRPRYKVGTPAANALNRLQREFTVAQPDQDWVADITYFRTYEGWLYLTVVLDLYSRRVVDWAMGSSMATELVLDALMMAVWRRRPKAPVMIHSDQGSQFGSDEFNRWCKDNLKPPRIPEPLRSRGWGILSHGIRPAELTPMLHGVGGGCSDGASPQSCL